MRMKLSPNATKWIALCLGLALLLVLATGCADNGSQPTPTPTAETGLTDDADAAEEGGATALEGSLYVVLVGTYVDDEQVAAFAETLQAAVPDIPLEVGGITTGDPDADPMFAMAGMTQLAGRMASGEADLIIADAANGARNTRGEAFIPLAGLTGLEDVAGREISFNALDDEGNETDEALPATGVSLEGIEQLAQAMPGSEVSAYVADTGNDAKTAASVEVINAMLQMVSGG